MIFFTTLALFVSSCFANLTSTNCMPLGDVKLDKNWKVQLPISNGNNNMLILPPSKALKMYPDIFGMTGAEITMKVDIPSLSSNYTLATSPNSEYYRTELAEKKTFSLADTTIHKLSFDMSITNLENADKGVVIAQVHGAGPLPNIIIRLINGRIIAENHKNAKGTSVKNSPIVVQNYVLSDLFHMDIVAGNNKVIINYTSNSINTTTVINSSYSDQYFKVGCYCQSTSPKGICEVTIHNLNVT